MRHARNLLLAALGALGAVGCGDNEGPGGGDCDSPGQACTWAGLPGQVGFNGDGLHRLDTMMYWTMDLAFADDGTVWFIDWNNHLVRRVESDDTVKTFLGWIDPVFPGDGAPGGLERTPDGELGTLVQLNHPTDLVLEDDGKLLVMAWHNHKLREVDPATGRVRILAGGGAGFAGDGGPFGAAVFKQPKGLQRDAAGNLYVLDQQNFRIRRIDVESKVITTVAGNGMQGFAGDGKAATVAMLNFEAGSNPEPSGGLTVTDDTLYIADTLSNRIRAVDLDSGVITTLAGTGDPGYGGDGGPASDALLDHPRDLEIGPDGHLYVADTDNSVVRAIDLSTGVIRTVAGTGALGLDETDARPATETMLARPFSIDFDPDGNLFISDTINSRIVKVAR